MLSDDECHDLLRRYHASLDRHARERLVAEHDWLVQRCARRFSGRGEPHDDLVQVARIALVKAVDRFDPERGHRFVSFAFPTMLGELRRHFRDATWAVKVPRRLKDLTTRLAASRDELTQELGRPPRVDELARALGVHSDIILQTIEADHVYRTASLDGPLLGGSGEGTALEILVGTDDARLEGADLRVSVSAALARLDERSRSIVVWTFYEGLTQHEIGERLGVGQVQVSRLLRGALVELRGHLAHERAGHDITVR